LTKLIDDLFMLEFKEEKLCQKHGHDLVAGIDEVGRGCLAGPVVASAVIMRWNKSALWFKKVRDSKLLSPERREYLSSIIHDSAISIGTGVVGADVIDSQGMTRAVRLAMKKALRGLWPQPEFVLIDYLTIPDLDLPHKGVEEGDTLCFSIACASIVAKVFRDHLMIDLDKKYPGYGLARHKGYGTEEHMACLRKAGPSPIHRRSFRPVKELAEQCIDDIRYVQVGLI
jgi:ribonuclease HII